MILSQACSISRPLTLQASALKKAVTLSRRTWTQLPVKRKTWVPKTVVVEHGTGQAIGSLGEDSQKQSDAGEKLVAAAAQVNERGDFQEGGASEASGKLLSAVGLILGTAVGPGILGLPAATLPAGLQASTAMILGAWAYVIASILLVAEVSCAIMAETGQKEVSFTALVSHTLGHRGACVVALVYATLNYALLVACISGLGSILQAWLLLPLPVPLLSAATAAVVGGLVAFAPFEIIDGLNQGLCGLMIAAITSLVFLGVYSGRELLVAHQTLNNVASFSSLLSAVPLTVLTLGFHVITPVVCAMVGGKPEDARRAIVIGGAIPLAMVLTWNAVVLGLAPPNSTSLDPIKLLLSLNKSAAPSVQAFAFAALGTSFIGYALSFPKQLGDALQLFRKESDTEEGAKKEANGMTDAQYLEALIWALAPPTAIAVFWPTAFASALDFAGIYANCFLFGILPPAMAWIHRYFQTTEGTILPTSDKPLVPGGKLLLLLLLGFSVILGIGPNIGGS